jgi:hypothetical protein
MNRCLAALLAAALIGCSDNSKVLQELEQQRASLEKQQQVITEMSSSMKDIEERHRQSQSALSAKETENKELARKLAAAQARIDQVAQRVEQETRRPTFTVEAPKIEVQRPPAPVVRKKSADLIIQSVNVYGTKTNGSVWDDSGPPDPKVRVSAGSDSYTTFTKHDTETASFGVKSIRVAEGDTLEVTVYDSDVVFDDEIGSYSKLITADTLSQGKVTWSFGRVYELVLKFEP